MFDFSVLVICVITIILLKIFLNINFKTMKKLEIENTDMLNKIASKFPEDKKICETILKQLNNSSNVNIKIKPEYNSCLYTVYNNTITIGKFQQNYMKIQTIAHECIHSSQSKRTLWSNFIFTNIYLLYFIIILILTFLNKLPYANIHTCILIFGGVIQFILRMCLENDAMIKAKYVAKEYIEKNKILTSKEEEILLEEYDRVNKVGIPFLNYYQVTMNLIKIIIFSFFTLV